MDAPVAIWERNVSRKLKYGRDNTSRSRLFLISGAADESEALALASGYVPQTYLGLPIESIDIDELEAGERYEAEATYSIPQRNHDVGTTWIDWDTTGGTVKITNSLKTIKQYVSPSSGLKAAPDFKGAINVHDKTVDGVDITIPALKIVLTSVMSFDVVGGMNYAKLASGLAGTTNKSPVLTFDKDELLFLGMTGTTKQTSEDQPGSEVKFHFAASQTVKNLSIADITNIKKTGHQYVWMWFQEFDDAANVTIPRVAVVSVESVYQSADWGALQLPNLTS